MHFTLVRLTVFTDTEHCSCKIVNVFVFSVEDSIEKLLNLESPMTVPGAKLKAATTTSCTEKEQPTSPSACASKPKIKPKPKTSAASHDTPRSLPLKPVPAAKPSNLSRSVTSPNDAPDVNCLNVCDINRYIEQNSTQADDTEPDLFA